MADPNPNDTSSPEHMKWTQKTRFFTQMFFNVVNDATVNFNDNYPINTEILGPNSARVTLNDGTVLNMKRYVNGLDIPGWYLDEMISPFIDTDSTDKISNHIQSELSNLIEMLNNTNVTDTASLPDISPYPAPEFIDMLQDALDNRTLTGVTINSVDNIQMRDRFSDNTGEHLVVDFTINGNAKGTASLDIISDPSTGIITNINFVSFVFIDLNILAGSNIGYDITQNDMSKISELLISYDQIMRDASKEVNDIMALYDPNILNYQQVYDYYSSIWSIRNFDKPLYDGNADTLSVWINDQGTYDFAVDVINPTDNNSAVMHGRVKEFENDFRLIDVQFEDNIDPSQNDPLMKPINELKDKLFAYHNAVFSNGDAITYINSIMNDVMASAQELPPGNKMFIGMDIDREYDIMPMWLESLSIKNDKILNDVSWWPVTPINQYIGEAPAGAEYVIMVFFKYGYDNAHNYNNYEFFLKNYPATDGSPVYKIMGIREYNDFENFSIQPHSGPDTGYLIQPSMHISWEPVSGATNYEISIKTSYTTDDSQELLYKSSSTDYDTYILPGWWTKDTAGNDYTMIAGNRYVISVTAEDSNNNILDESSSYLYAPSNVDSWTVTSGDTGSPTIQNADIDLSSYVMMDKDTVIPVNMYESEDATAPSDSGTLKVIASGDIPTDPAEAPGIPGRYLGLPYIVFFHGDGANLMVKVGGKTSNGVSITLGGLLQIGDIVDDAIDEINTSGSISNWTTQVIPYQYLPDSDSFVIPASPLAISMPISSTRSFKQNDSNGTITFVEHSTYTLINGQQYSDVIHFRISNDYGDVEDIWFAKNVELIKYVDSESDSEDVTILERQ